MIPFWRHVWFWRLYRNRFYAIFWHRDWDGDRYWRELSLNIGMFPRWFDGGCAYEWGFRLRLIFGATLTSRLEHDNHWLTYVLPVRVRLHLQRGPEPIITSISYERGWLPHEPIWWPWKISRKAA